MATINDLGMPNPITVPFGGTGLATIAANSALMGNGTGNIVPTGPGIDGQILIGSSTGNPIWATLTAGTNATIINGNNSIDIRSTASAGTSVTTFTPVLNFTTSSAGISYNTQTGRAVVIGKIVYFNFYIALNSKGTSSGNAFITGFPGTFAGQANTPCSILIFNSSGNPAGTYSTIGNVVAASSQVNLLSANANSGNPPITDTTFSNTTIVQGSGFYFTT